MAIRVLRFCCSVSGSLLICGLLTGAGLMIGCQTAAKKDPEPQMATPDKVAAFRELIQKSQPGAQVGRVIEVIPGYASVVDLPLQEVNDGETITFVDGDGKPISNGTVYMHVGDSVHVKVEKAGRRPPQKGDLAVWLKS
jgi:hypothetical protein